MEFNFPETPSKIAIAGDWHGNIEYAETAIDYVERNNSEVVMHVGDFGYNFTDSFLGTLTDRLEEHDMTLLFVDGNHENFNWLLAQPVNDYGVRPLSSRIAHIPRGFTWDWGTERWMGLGGAASVDRQWRQPGMSWWYQELLTNTDIDFALAQGEVDHLVLHDAPSNAVLPGITFEGGRRQGFPVEDLIMADRHRQAVQEVVDGVQPKHLWCGHYHLRATVDAPHAGGSGTLNVLAQDGRQFADNIAFWDVR